MNIYIYEKGKKSNNTEIREMILLDKTSIIGGIKIENDL
jgi:hypothetical protein